MGNRKYHKNTADAGTTKYFDYSLLFLIIFLLCFGLVMLYSTSSYYGSTRFGDTAYYLKKQLFATSLGIIAMIIVSRIPYRFWMRVSGLAYLMAFGLCYLYRYGSQRTGALDLHRTAFVPAIRVREACGHHFPGDDHL